MECPIMLSPFMTIQHGHFSFMHTSASSCLHTVQIHGCCCILPNCSISFFSLRDLSSEYSHRNTTGIPIAKKMSIVRTGTFKTNNARPKINTPIPKVASQRFVSLSISILIQLSPNVSTFTLAIFNIFVLFIQINNS